MVVNCTFMRLEKQARMSLIYNVFMDPKKMTNEDWKKKLTPEQYNVMRENGTEPPFTGKYTFKHDNGMYTCAACGAKLFNSDAKFESKEPGLAGWPSFDKPENMANIEFRDDNFFGMGRKEVICKNCGSHLGHLFSANDSKTSQHYCINSCALEFNPSNLTK